MYSRPILYASLGFLMVVSIIELSFISEMVGWFHHRASGTFIFNFEGSPAILNAQPKNFLVNQGHTSNGASGTAFILIGIGGFLVLRLHSRQPASRCAGFLYHTWLVFNVLSLLLTFSSLIYVFVVTNNHRRQRIDPGVAARLHGRPYNLESWTPQNWFSAVLKLDLSYQNDRTDIRNHLRIIRGWQYNLIPFFIIQLFEICCAIWDYTQQKKRQGPRYSLQKGSE